MALTPLISLNRCQPGRGTFVEIAGREIAVFVLGQPPTPHVIDNACPHANGNLSAGACTAEVVACPWHDWRFDLRTGACVDSPKVRVRRYKAEIRDGEVWVDLDSAGEP
ncbi:MAG: Rieske (2Fe-2S) protein [Gemmatimonadaceae bacterium]|nr:Rieske (2Fe-2S) protein [Gemmatimonadaceae bacterium]